MVLSAWVCLFCDKPQGEAWQRKRRIRPVKLYDRGSKSDSAWPLGIDVEMDSPPWILQVRCGIAPTIREQRRLDCLIYENRSLKTMYRLLNLISKVVVSMKGTRKEQTRERGFWLMYTCNTTAQSVIWWATVRPTWTHFHLLVLCDTMNTEGLLFRQSGQRISWLLTSSFEGKNYWISQCGVVVSLLFRIMELPGPTHSLDSNYESFTVYLSPGLLRDSILKYIWPLLSTSFQIQIHHLQVTPPFDST
jgi:hypothetical protein